MTDNEETRAQHIKAQVRAWRLILARMTSADNETINQNMQAVFDETDCEHCLYDVIDTLAGIVADYVTSGQYFLDEPRHEYCPCEQDDQSCPQCRGLRSWRINRIEFHLRQLLDNAGGTSVGPIEGIDL